MSRSSLNSASNEFKDLLPATSVSSGRIELPTVETRISEHGTFALIHERARVASEKKSHSRNDQSAADEAIAALKSVSLIVAVGAQLMHSVCFPRKEGLVAIYCRASANSPRD